MKRILTTVTTLTLSALLLAGSRLSAREHRPAKIKASAIQVEMIQSDEISLPAEFQVALYENLVRQLEKKGAFAKVFRDGDRSATNAADLIVLHSTVRSFKAGSERARQVTTVAGTTSITIHCQFYETRRNVSHRAGRQRQGPIFWRESQSDVRLR